MSSLLYKGDTSDGDFRLNGTQGGTVFRRADAVQSVRTRFETSQVNAGATILPAIPGFRYRLVDITLIAIGGNAATATSVDILATQSASGVKLIAAAVAALAQNAIAKPNSSNVSVLTGGASFAVNDANTAITIAKTGDPLATATHIDVVLNYVVEAE